MVVSAVKWTDSCFLVAAVAAVNRAVWPHSALGLGLYLHDDHLHQVFVALWGPRHPRHPSPALFNWWPLRGDSSFQLISRPFWLPQGFMWAGLGIVRHGLTMGLWVISGGIRVSLGQSDEGTLETIADCCCFFPSNVNQDICCYLVFCFFLVTKRLSKQMIFNFAGTMLTSLYKGRIHQTQ